MRKKTSEIKIVRELEKNESKFLEIIKQEWDVLQKQVKKERLVQEGKEAAFVTAKVLFAMLAVVGVCTIAAVAPNVFGMYGPFSRRRTYVNKKGTAEKLQYMKRCGYVEVEKLEKMKYRVRLTDKGRAKMYLTLFDEMGKGVEKKWDRVWRIVTFDIPETHKKERDGFRKKLEDIGFFRIQKSVFVCPYACEKELAFIMSIFGIEEYVKIIEAKALSGEGELWKRFGI